MRSRYGSYPEYHTSLDDLSVISQEGLTGSLNVLQRAIEMLELNYVYENVVVCEPKLGARGLKPTLNTKSVGDESRLLMDMLAYANGRADLLEIAERIGADFFACAEIAQVLERHQLLRRVQGSATQLPA